MAFPKSFGFLESFFVNRKDYRQFLSFSNSANKILARIQKLLDNKDESIYFCFRKIPNKFNSNEEGFFKSIQEYVYCTGIFLSECKQIIKNSSQVSTHELAESISILLSSLDKNNFDNLFIFSRSKKPLLEGCLENMCSLLLSQADFLPPILKYDKSKGDVLIILNIIGRLNSDLDKFYADLRSLISLFEDEGKQIQEIQKEGLELCKHAQLLCNNILENSQLLRQIAPKLLGKEDISGSAEKLFRNVLCYLKSYHERMLQNLKRSRSYSPSIEVRTLQEYILRLEEEIARIEQEGHFFKHLYDLYLQDNQSAMARLIQERNPACYVGYNLQMTAYCGVVPKPLVFGMWTHTSSSSSYISPEGYAQKLSHILLKEGYRPSSRYTVLEREVFGPYHPKNDYFFSKKHTAYGGNIALISFSVKPYCVFSYGDENAIFTPHIIPSKNLTLYIQNPAKLKAELEFVFVRVHGEGNLSLSGYIARFKSELDRLGTPYKLDFW